MLDKDGLEILLIKRHKTKIEWAKYLGISTAALYRKLNGQSDFFREEIQKSCLFFQLDDMSKYFFAKKVS